MNNNKKSFIYNQIMRQQQLKRVCLNWGLILSRQDSLQNYFYLPRGNESKKTKKRANHIELFEVER